MACLPETGQDEKNMGETAAERGSWRRFGTGFFARVLTALVCIFVFMAGWLYAQKSVQKSEQEKESEDVGASVLTESETLYKLNEIQSIIEQHYLNEVDSSNLSNYLFKGAVAGLDDPYANYYSAEELQSVLDSSRGEYIGIGATLSEDIRTKEIRVLEVYDGGTAKEAGLKPGDQLLALEDTAFEGCGLSEVVSLIKSRDGPFTLTVYRPETEEELQLEMECREIHLEYVQYEMLEGKIGYIRLSEFTKTSVEQFQNAAKELKRQGMEKLVVDLRNNPGGLLDVVCDILDEILPKGVIVYTEDRDGNRKEYKSDVKRSITCEVAVLVNGNSASASEIFAGAIQDYEIGPVVGTQTYGKGVVQKTYTLSDGSALKLTTEKYYTPKGQDIDGNGITPDIVVEEQDMDSGQIEEKSTDQEKESGAETNQDEEKDEVLEKALEVLQE